MSVPKDTDLDYASFKESQKPSLSDLSPGSEEVVKIPVKKQLVKKQIESAAKQRSILRAEIARRITDSETPLTSAAKIRLVDYLRQWDKKNKTTIQERAKEDPDWMYTGYEGGT